MITLVIIFYLLPLIGSFLIMHQNYSKGGVFYKLQPTFVDVLLVILPFWNIITIFVFGHFNSKNRG